MRVNRVEMLYKLSLLLCFWYNKIVINLPPTQSRFVSSSADGLGFNLSYQEVGHNGADLGPCGCSLDPFIILTLEEVFLRQNSKSVLIC